MTRTRSCRRWCFIAACLSGSAAYGIDGPSIMFFGDTGAIAQDLSVNPLVVTGQRPLDSGEWMAFRWTPGGGVQDLGDLPGGLIHSESIAVNSDGSVIVGFSKVALGWEAFRWSQATGMEAIGELRGGAYDSSAYDCSADGTIVVGMSHTAAGYQAFRWSAATGMVGLGGLPGGKASEARGISADGLVIVGSCNVDSDPHATRWAPNGAEDLGDLAGGSHFSSAEAANADGSVVVGWSISGKGYEAFRWTNATGIVGLGQLPSNKPLSAASGVSADGSVVVGGSWTAPGFGEAYFWTEQFGMVNLRTWLMERGVPGLKGRTLAYAASISPDGRTIVGGVTNPDQMFIAYLGANLCPADCNANGALDSGDFACFRDHFAAGDEYADFDGNGDIDVDDFIRFQMIYWAGCP